MVEKLSPSDRELAEKEIAKQKKEMSERLTKLENAKGKEQSRVVNFPPTKVNIEIKGTIPFKAVCPYCNKEFETSVYIKEERPLEIQHPPLELIFPQSKVEPKKVADKLEKR